MFSTQEVYEKVRDSGLFDRSKMAALFGQDEADVQVFFLDIACAVKVSFPRPHSSGSVADGDTFGGQQYAPILDLMVDI